MMTRALTPVFLGSLVAGLAHAAGSLPASHMIPNVPWHEQMNGLFCGPGSLEIVFDYWGPDIAQKPIADVARSSSIGTWCQDILRAGHFSCLSAAQGRFFPGEAPTAGFPERPLGYAAFAHAAESLWLDDLKGLLAADIPVILLMHYGPDSTSGGHYRVAIGYDDLQGLVYFSDPWGRDLRYVPGLPGVLAWTYDELETGWNYVAYGTPLPFHGVAILPWEVDVRVKGKPRPDSTITVTALVHYPCPRPFDSTEFPAQNATATITLPAGWSLEAGGSATVDLGPLPAGTVQTASWQVRVGPVITGATVTVSASGLISGAVPEARWEGEGVAYPPYGYTDLIGGTGSTTF
jgi:hypothetical protein